MFNFDYYKFLKPFLFRMDEEKAHNLAIKALKYNLLPKRKLPQYNSLEIKVMNINFASPIGLAAGFDKNAECIQGLKEQGFAFAECGTVTPLPQLGNDKPRLFRLIDDGAIINRMGFNNKGLDYFCNNLKNRPQDFILGSNIGKNKLSSDAAADYLLCLTKIYNYCDYVTVNISSPNTPNLRDLQRKQDLQILLQAINNKRQELQKIHNKYTPILLKIAPDISDKEAEDIVEEVLANKIDGIIVSNTSLSRDGLKSQSKNEAGGLSGKPIFAKSTDLLKIIYKLTNGKILLIGVGGVTNGMDAYIKIKAGASLVQIYSSLIYHGFDVIHKINSELDALLKYDNFANIKDAVGVEVN